jgi:Galactose mutarotase and related enzymes
MYENMSTSNEIETIMGYNINDLILLISEIIMIKTIGNRFLAISVNSYAAELAGIEMPDKKQLLWQGDPEYWTRRAPVLFPIVGSLPDNKYEFNGNVYEMGTHGFASTSEFELQYETEDELAYKLTDNKDSLCCYPFHFELVVAYKLVESTLQQKFYVKNTGSDYLPFSIGAHTGFNCPLFEDESFKDYSLVFERKENAQRRLLKGKLPGDETVVFLDNEKEKQLGYDMFDMGAVILSGLESDWVKLRSKKSDFEIKIDYSGFPYLFIWSPPLKHAPFICIEPCHGIGTRAGKGRGFLEKEGLICLEPGNILQSIIKYTFISCIQAE